MFQVGSVGSEEFFDQPAYLTVSGQLQAEMMACALSRVYAFGPSFRAENSNTARHLAEFWMCEPEMAFADVHDAIELAETVIRSTATSVLDSCADDLSVTGGAENCTQLHAAVQDPFAVASYTDCVSALQASNVAFEQGITWGEDLRSEHEQWLAGSYFGKPVFVVDWPRSLKPFYMRLNADNKTVAAFDLLVPRVGELIGGSGREERLPQLLARLDELGMDPEEHQAYIDLRKYGTVPHAGFGIGFERLVMWLTGLQNVRDVALFPRYPGWCKF